jgi:hypothetical protein
MTRKQLLRRLRRLARERQTAFEVIEKRGKGGHWLVRWNSRVTTIPQSKGGDLKPGTLAGILEKLGIDARDL